MKEQLSNRAENMLTTGGNTRFEQFLLLSPCFQNVFEKPSAAEVSEGLRRFQTFTRFLILYTTNLFYLGKS